VLQQCYIITMSPGWCVGSFVGVECRHCVQDARRTHHVCSTVKQTMPNEMSYQSSQSTQRSAACEPQSLWHWSHTWEVQAAARLEWRKVCYTAVDESKGERVYWVKVWRARRKADVLVSASHRQCNCSPALVDIMVTRGVVAELHSVHNSVRCFFDLLSLYT